MKIVAYIGIAMGAIAAIAGIYDYAVVQPDKEIAMDIVFSAPDSFFGTPEHHALLDQMEFGTDFAIIVMGLGLLAFIVSIIPAIKKEKLAWIGVALSLVGFFIGAGYGTHMFS